MKTALTGGQCGTTACLKRSLDELTRLLDTSAARANVKGDAADHLPAVVLEPMYGLRRDLFDQGFARFRFAMVSPHPMECDSKLSWAVCGLKLPRAEPPPPPHRLVPSR